MKTFWMTFVVCICALTVLSIAQTPAELPNTSLSREQIEENYLCGLNSDVPGLQVSCAYFLGEMKSDRAVIPLMKMFRDENNSPGQRLMAAWSLYKIGDARGLYLIKCEGENSNCDYTRCLCDYFYRDHCLKNGGADSIKLITKY
jgi:hypothetical protein